MSAPREALVDWILFGAFCSSVLMAGVVGFAVRAAGGSLPGDPAVGTVLSLLPLLAGVAATAVLAGGRAVVARHARVYRTWFVVRLALAESPAFLGLVAFLLGATSLAFAADVAWSLALLALCAPTAADRAAFERDAARR